MDRVYNWDDSKSPATFPAIIPRGIYQLFHPGYITNDNSEKDIKWGRYLMCIYTLIAAGYLFFWCEKLFSTKAATFALIFFLFSPLVLGCSMLVLSDMATAAGMIGTFYHLWSFIHSKSNKQFLFFVVWLGVSMVIKASLVFFDAMSHTDFAYSSGLKTISI